MTTPATVALEPVDHDAAPAPFEQLRAQVARRVHEGELPAGARLPTVRAASAALGLAVNTVARAYRELEADGVVVTEGRRGTFVATVPLGSAATDDAASAAAAYAGAARRLGLTLDHATRLLERSWASPEGR